MIPSGGGSSSDFLKNKLLNNQNNIIYELMLKSGFDLNAKIEKKEGFFLINNGKMILVLESISFEIFQIIIESTPNKIIVLDSVFKQNDELKTNVLLQFKQKKINFETI